METTVTKRKAEATETMSLLDAVDIFCAHYKTNIKTGFMLCDLARTVINNGIETESAEITMPLHSAKTLKSMESALLFLSFNKIIAIDYDEPDENSLVVEFHPENVIWHAESIIASKQAEKGGR